MGNKRISELQIETNPKISDLIALASDGQSKRTALGSILNAEIPSTFGTTTINGDLNVNGTLNVSTIVSASVLYDSGSTIFGNSLDDTHDFIGDVTISGSLFVSGGSEFGGDLVPKTPQGARLGTPENPFRELFLQSGSISIESDTPGDPSAVISNNNGNLDISVGGMRLIQSDASFVAPTGSFEYLSGSFTHIGSAFRQGNTIVTGSFAVSGSTVQIGDNTLDGLTKLRGNVSVLGNTTIEGTTTFSDSSTTVTGSFLISGSTTQIGNNTLDGNTILSGSVNIIGNTTIEGTTNFSDSSTTVTGSFLISGSTTQIGDNTLDGDTILSGSVNIIGNTDIKGTTTFSDSSTTVTGSFLISGSTTQIGNNTLDGNTILSGSVNIIGNTTIEGTTNFSNSSTTVTGSFLVSGSTTQIGNNTLDGDTILSGSVDISGSLTITGETQHIGSVDITGDYTINGNSFSSSLFQSSSISGSVIEFTKGDNTTQQVKIPDGLGYSGLGWARYNDTTYTTSSAFTIVDGADVKIPCNGSGSIETHMHSSIPFFNPNSQLIQAENDGDVYSITVDFSMRAVTNPADGDFVRLQMNNTVGAPYTRVGRDLFFSKKDTEWHRFHEIFQYYADTDFVINGNEFNIIPIGVNIYIADVIIFIQRTQNHSQH